MKLRRAIGYGAAALGATVAADRVLRGAAGELEAAVAGRQRTYRWRGMSVAYTEAGDEDDPTLCCLHGLNAAGSSGEFREVWDALAEEYHVVAPDLPGFGRSDRPPLRYSAAFYEDFVADFLSRYDRPAVLASSLTGAYVARAVDEGAAVDSLLLVCPTTVAGPSPSKGWLCELLRSPVVGTALVNLLASKPSIRYFNADHGYADPSKADPEWVDYQWRSAHQENARFAVASFVAGYCNSEVDLGAALGGVDAPVTIVWGREADLPPLSRGRDLAAEADARLVVFDHARLLPHVEFPEQFVETARDALAPSAAGG